MKSSTKFWLIVFGCIVIHFVKGFLVANPHFLQNTWDLYWDMWENDDDMFMKHSMYPMVFSIVLLAIGSSVIDKDKDNIKWKLILTIPLFFSPLMWIVVLSIITGYCILEGVKILNKFLEDINF